MAITVKRVDSANKKQMIKYFKNQSMFYQNDPNFVPQIIGERLSLVNKQKNAFYQHGDIAHFIAYRDGGITGQISAITNENHNEAHNDNIGFFGFFECEDDQEVATALVHEALKWNMSKGKNAMRGPFHPSVNDELGILIEGFHEPPNVLMRYNPPYYDKLLLGAGMCKEMDLFAYDLQMDTFITEKMLLLKDKIIARYKIECVSIDLKNRETFTEQLAALKRVYDEAWEDHWGSVKMTDAEFFDMAAGLKQVVNPKLPFLVYANGELAGMALVVQDINQIMIHNKKQNLLGMVWKMITKGKSVNRVRIIMLGVLPKFQMKGIDAVMYYEVGKRAKECGYMRGEASWVLEDNEMMKKAATQTMNGKLYKKYRIYEIAAEQIENEQILF